MRAWILPIAVVFLAYVSPGPARGHAQRSVHPCSRGSTRAIIEVREISDFFACGTPGLTEVVLRIRVRGVIAGPRRARRLLVVLPCPSPDLAVGDRLEVCLGEPPPTLLHFRFDDFEHDPRERLYMRSVAMLARERREPVE